MPADDLAECIKLSNSPKAAQKSPENYTIFIAHICMERKMEKNTGLLGKKRNFEIQRRGGNRVFGATQDGKN